jgi:1-acyl-sn-glycerol-3-phosphate acyltransferase
MIDLINNLAGAGTELLLVLSSTMLDIDVQWHAPLPPGPKILAPNHPTTTDPFYILMLTSEPVAVLVTESAFRC